MLAILYLEDGVETDRAVELANIAHSLVKEPAWDDIYLQALHASAASDERAPQLINALMAATPEGDPRRPRVEKYLATA